MDVQELQKALDTQRARADAVEERLIKVRRAIELLYDTCMWEYWEWLQQTLNMPLDISCLPFHSLEAKIKELCMLQPRTCHMACVQEQCNCCRGA